MHFTSQKSYCNLGRATADGNDLAWMLDLVLVKVLLRSRTRRIYTFMYGFITLTPRVAEPEKLVPGWPSASYRARNLVMCYNRRIQKPQDHRGNNAASTPWPRAPESTG